MSGRNVLVAKAWPYANGPLHFGHIAGLLPADALARYFRLAKDNVLFVSGSDCHGTPILNRAIEEGKSPAEIADFYHQQFLDHFSQLGFSHDLYNKTADPRHHEIAQQILQRLYHRGYVIAKKTPHLFSATLDRLVADREVEGTCPDCGALDSRGDQCDACGKTYEATELISPRLKNGSGDLIIVEAEHLHLDLRKVEAKLRAWVEEKQTIWRENAFKTTMSWLADGLKTREVTRDIDWGVSVTIPGFENKRIYVWFEAVIGYLSASIIRCGGDLDGGEWEKWWRPEYLPIHYYVHGKDNIPFHTIIFPAMLLGLGDLALPNIIASSEYLTLPEGKKFSTSQGYGATVSDYFDMVGPVEGLTVDSLRFFILARNPEARDSPFSWASFSNFHNAELVNKFANLFSRVHALTEKHFENRVPVMVDGFDGHQEIRLAIDSCYSDLARLYEGANFRAAVDRWLELVVFANKFINTHEPWKQVAVDMEKAAGTLYVAWQLIYNLLIMIYPVIPFAVEKAFSVMNITVENANSAGWVRREILPGLGLNVRTSLFTRINRDDLPED